jgi:hypothetical protein
MWSDWSLLERDWLLASLFSVFGRFGHTELLQRMKIKTVQKLAEKARVGERKSMKGLRGKTRGRWRELETGSAFKRAK